MLAAYTDRAEYASSFVSVSDAKDYLGIFTDPSSEDAMIQNFLHAAEHLIISQLGETIRTNTTTDYYPSFSDVMVLSDPIRTTATVTVQQYADDTWSAVSGGVVDPFGRRAQVTFNPVPATPDSKVRYPVRLSYQPITVDHDQAKVAIMQLVKIFYDERSMNIDGALTNAVLNRLTWIKRHVTIAAA